MNNASRLRKLYRKTQNEISDIIGYAKPLYAAFEHGKLPLPEKNLQKLADFYNVSVDYLVADIEFKTEW